MSVSKRLRYEVLRRDNHTCRYCGSSAPEVKLTIDHVMPVALGGADEPTNLVTACANCNAGKSSSSPDAAHVENVSEDAIRWAKAMERAAEIQELVAREDRMFTQTFFDLMTDMVVRDRGLKPPTLEAHGGTHGADRSLLTFRAQGLDMGVLLEAIGNAMSNSQLSRDDVWRYFCGICWRRIDQMHGTARSLISEGAI